jgi:DNA-binding SARP family transcriptional activator
MAALTGQFERGDAIAERALHMVASPDASPPHAIWTLLQVGYLRFSEARYEEALDCVRRACGVADANGLRATFVHVFMFRFMIEFRVAGWDVANATLAEIERLPRPAGAMAQGLLHVYQARRAQFAGDCEEAANLAEMTHAAMLRTGSPYQEMIFGLIDGELWLNAGRVEKARQAIARSREIVERSPIFDCFLAAVVFCEAFLARAEGKGESCMERLTQALALAREGRRRYYLRYLECCMPPLFSLALEEGIEVEFVQQMIRMFRLPAPADAPDVWPRAVQIRTLGGFQVRVNGEALEFARKVPKKTLALLKALIAHGGEEVSEDWLCDALWGDEEADAARQALGITVVRLRKLLGKADAIRQHGGSTALDRRLCWVDAWRFEQLLRDDASTNATSRALALYGGTFLPEDEGESWTVATRERLRGRFVHALATTGLALEAAGRADDAIRLYLRGLDADPIVETFSQGLMRCLRALGRHSEAAGVFRRLRQTLSVVLGVSPSQESERLYRDILSDMAGAGPRLVDVSLSPEALHGATAAGIRQRRR